MNVGSKGIRRVSSRIWWISVSAMSTAAETKGAGSKADLETNLTHT